MYAHPPIRQQAHTHATVQIIIRFWDIRYPVFGCRPCCRYLDGNDIQKYIFLHKNVSIDIFHIYVHIFNHIQD
jgi:hypothetical protein